MTTTNPIVLLAPAPNMVFAAMPSGATYVSNQYGLVTITNGSVADQQALVNAGGCLTLSPITGGAVSVQPDTSYTIQSTDYNDLLLFTAAAAIEISLPNSLPQGFTVELMQGAGGTITANAATGATLLSPSGTSSSMGQGASLNCTVVSNSTGANAMWSVVPSPSLPQGFAPGSLSAVICPNVAGNIVNAPTGTEAAGAVYIVSTSPFGAFAGQSNAIAYLQQNGTWTFTVPVAGQKIYIQASGQHYTYLSGSWSQDGIPSAVTQFAGAVAAATTAALPANTYANGTSGVGATLTGNSNGSLSTQDGIALTVSQRLLVMNEATPAHNGIYSLTTVGSGSAPYVLTRAADADTAALLGGMGVFVTGGTVNVGLTFAQQLAAGSITVGTTSLNFVQIGGTAGIATETVRAEAAEATLTANVATNTAAIAASLGSQTIGASVAASGSVIGVGDTLINAISSTVTGYVSSFSVAVGTAQAAQLLIVEENGDGTLTLISQTAVELAVGVNTITNVNPAVSAGQYVGIWVPEGMYKPSSSTNTTWYLSGLPSTETSKNVLTNYGLQFSVTIDAPVLNAVNSIPSIESALGTTQIIGPPEIALVSTCGGSNISFINAVPVADNGYITSFSVAAYYGPSQQAELLVVELNGDGTLTLVDSLSITLQGASGTGAITILNGVNLQVSAGQYVGIYMSQPSVVTGGLTCWYASGLIGTETAKSSISGYGLQFSVTIESGLTGEVGNLSTSLGGLGGALPVDGTGTTDATSAFAQARASASNVYVPPGDYSVTVLQSYGDGLWGPGQVRIGSTLFPIYTKPSPSSLYGKLRTALAPQIGSNSPLVLIGDSITQGIGPTTDAATWSYQLAAYLNLYTSPGDVPELVNFDSLLVPSFFGVTIPSSPTVGTNGPTAQSLILEASQSISFTGAFAYVDVFYTQQPGAGSLVFSYNGGSAYKTVNCAGSMVLDSCTYPSATGETANGTYTITASGGAVEITGLLRLAATLSDASPRLAVMNHAHGGYAFATYTTAMLDSVIKQSQFAGGTNPAAIIALGENDQVATLPSTIYTNATSMISALKAGGFKSIWGCGILRPTYTEYSYSSGCSYDGANGAIRSAFRDAGVPIIPIDAVDFIGLGLISAEPPHPDNAGQIKYLQVLAEGMAG